MVGVRIFNFISFNAEIFSLLNSFKQGVPGSIPGWLTNHKPLCNRKCVYYKGFSCFLRVFNTLSFCITAIEKAVNFGFNAPELIKNSSLFVYLTFRLLQCDFGTLNADLQCWKLFSVSKN